MVQLVAMMHSAIMVKPAMKHVVVQLDVVQPGVVQPVQPTVQLATPCSPSHLVVNPDSFVLRMSLLLCIILVLLLVRC